MYRRNIQLLALCAGMAGGAEGVVAQESENRSNAYRLPVLAQASGEGGVYELPPIDVTATIPAEVQNTPGAATRLTSEEMIHSAPTR